MEVEHVDEQLVALAAWCATPDAAAAANHLLRTRHLPTDADHVDDVLAEVQFRVVRRIRRTGPLEHRDDGRDPVVPYTRFAMGTVVDDLLRGRRIEAALVPLDGLQRFDGLDGLDGMDALDAPDAGNDPTATAVDVVTGNDAADGVRRQLHLAVRPSDAWLCAAALAVVVLALEPDHRLEPATPCPDGGDDDQIAKWAGLHYAGRDDCFTDQHGPPDSACRNRRLRALQRVDHALADAYRAAVANEVAQ